MAACRHRPQLKTGQDTYPIQGRFCLSGYDRMTGGIILEESFIF